MAFQEPIIAELGQPKMEGELAQIDEELEAAVRAYAHDILQQAVKTLIKSQQPIWTGLMTILEHFAEIYPEQIKQVAAVVDSMMKKSCQNGAGGWRTRRWPQTE